MPNAIQRFVSGLGVLTLLVLAIFLWHGYVQRSAAVTGDVSDFKDTEIVLHPDVPLSPDKNVIWCGTMALAWNEMIALLGEKLHFVNPIPVAELLNRQEFTKADLDEESYVVVADTEDHHVSDRIRDDMKNKFGESVEPRLLPDDSGQDAQKLTAFVCLHKNLDFPKPFHDNIPLLFDARQVADFGFGLKPYSDGDEELTSQVKVLSYVSDDSFVIQLKTKEDEDQLILAKVPPGKTLQATIESVLPTLKTDVSWGVNLQDDLAVPNVNFNLTSDFKELEGQYLNSDKRLDKMAEDILFQLNATGVKLSAFTTITATLAYDANPPPPRHFIFNKPFLFLLKRASSPRPYFALWVGNPTLLVSP